MRKIREVLRLRFAAGLSARRIALSIDVARSTVSEVLQRASDRGLGWTRNRLRSMAIWRER